NADAGSDCRARDAPNSRQWAICSGDGGLASPMPRRNSRTSQRACACASSGLAAESSSDTACRWRSRRTSARRSLSANSLDVTACDRQLAEAVTAVAERLAAAGIRVGDRVAIVGDHGPYWVAGLLGVLARGAIAVPLDRAAGAAGLAALLRDADPAFVLFGPNDEDQVRAGLARAGNTAPAAPLAAVSAPVSETAPRPPTASRRTDATAIIMYPSGTTGTPKGVEVSWANLAYQVTAISGRQGVPPDAVFISVLPPHHLLELVAGCLAPLYLGARIHYPGSLLPADI